MYEGYLEFGGTPIINAEATEAYVRHMNPGNALKAVFNTDLMPVVNEEPAYRTPVLDQQPWVNPLDSSTHGFLGLYPISIEGLDGSTLSADVTEYLSEGGSVGIPRDTSRSIRVSGLLVGMDMLSAQAGLSWLTQALRSDDCIDCGAGVLRYFVAFPDVCETGAFGEEIDIHTESFGNASPGVYRYRFESDTVDPGMPMRVRWEAQWDEGVQIRFGAAPMDGIDPLQASPLIEPLRRNHALNPTFRTSLAGWVVSGAGVGTWEDSRDPLNPGFARLIAQILPPQGYGSGDYGSGPYGSLYDNGGLQMTTTTDVMPAGPTVAAADLRSATGQDTTISLSQNGSVFASLTVKPGRDWARYRVTGINPMTGPVTMSVGVSDQADVDKVQIEVGTTISGYFDGSTVDDGYSIAWEGATDASTSVRKWAQPAEITRDNAAFRPFIEIYNGNAKGLNLSWGVRAYQTMQDQLQPYERHLFRVAATSGVQVLRQMDLKGQGAFIQVEFTLVAGNPAPYSLPIGIDTTPLLNASFVDPEANFDIDDLSWLSDPNSVAVSRPASAPRILNPAIESISKWRRYYVPIPATAVADWNESIPTLAITSFQAAISQVRVRFHPNPFGYDVQSVDPAGFCSEFVVSYLPAVTRLEVDGVLERATASRGDKPSSPADHLLYGADGAPISWPRLSCAIPYLMTIDVPDGSTIDAFNVDLALRRKQ